MWPVALPMMSKLRRSTFGSTSWPWFRRCWHCWDTRFTRSFCASGIHWPPVSLDVVDAVRVWPGWAPKHEMWLGMRDAARGLRSASVAGEEVNLDLNECPRHMYGTGWYKSKVQGAMPDRERYRWEVKRDRVQLRLSRNEIDAVLGALCLCTNHHDYYPPVLVPPLLPPPWPQHHQYQYHCHKI